MSESVRGIIGEHSKQTLEFLIQVADKAGQQLSTGPSTQAGAHSSLCAKDVKIQLDDEIVRFKLWTSNIGVFADVQLSLDFRIREFPDVKDMFANHLSMIGHRLDQGMVLIKSGLHR
jgi:hypothetical protein